MLRKQYQFKRKQRIVYPFKLMRDRITNS
ncbi:hypothetical protein BRAO375_670011 [Bradyrhizobium sp. ORS 375]|nr:hypothetical protein BRAO375_670011 [Bradyrhizobium sp. ORS 375]